MDERKRKIFDDYGYVGLKIAEQMGEEVHVYTCILYYYCINLTSNGEGSKQTHVLYCLYISPCITCTCISWSNLTPASQNMSCPTYY